jgi:RNA polymerase sigma-70 factor (ECF subfamily)
VTVVSQTDPHARHNAPLAEIPGWKEDCFPDEEAEREEEVQRLMAEVEALPEEYRTVLMIYYYQDVTYKDLARMLDVSTATINARLTRARSMLRARLGAPPTLRKARRG